MAYSRCRNFDDMNSGDVQYRLKKLAELEKNMLMELKEKADKSDGTVRRADCLRGRIYHLKARKAILEDRLCELEDDSLEEGRLIKKLTPLSQRIRSAVTELKELTEGYNWSEELRVEYLHEQLKELQAERAELAAYTPPF